MYNCEPTIVETEQNFDCIEDGKVLFTYDDVYNCQKCNNTDCQYYYDYNQRERVVDKEFENDINELNRRLGGE